MWDRGYQLGITPMALRGNLLALTKSESFYKVTYNALEDNLIFPRHKPERASWFSSQVPRVTRKSSSNMTEFNLLKEG
ncbi:hypothetical protein TNCV_4742161 [Trichonephila clavipes]|nr:hypothetical protein TNCV_4742161 [Trichonephila clavipes]